MYIDPSNYDSPEDAVNEFASELDPSVLFLASVIGGGMANYKSCSFTILTKISLAISHIKIIFHT